MTASAPACLRTLTLGAQNAGIGQTGPTVVEAGAYVAPLMKVASTRLMLKYGILADKMHSRNPAYSKQAGRPV